MCKQNLSKNAWMMQVKFWNRFKEVYFWCNLNLLDMDCSAVKQVFKRVKKLLILTVNSGEGHNLSSCSLFLKCGFKVI